MDTGVRRHMSVGMLVGLLVLASVMPVVAVTDDNAFRTLRSGSAVEQPVTPASSGNLFLAEHPTGGVSQVRSGTANKTDSPSLDPTLRRLVGASNREHYAETHGLTMRNDSVRVVIELSSSHSLPDGYQLTTETRQTVGTRTLVQAHVNVDDLMGLAADSAVQYVRPPKQGQALDTAAAPSPPSNRLLHFLLFGGFVLTLGVLLFTAMYTRNS